MLKLLSHSVPVTIRCVIDFAALFQLQHRHCLILGDCREVGINKCVRVSLAALTREATVIETSVDEHLPNGRVTPVIRLALRPDADVKVVVATLQD